MTSRLCLVRGIRPRIPSRIHLVSSQLIKPQSRPLSTSLPSSLPFISKISTKSFLIRRGRETSFWAPSYNPPIAPNVPLVPVPKPAHLASNGESTSVKPPVVQKEKQGDRRKETKERYLQGLMEKAGELSLRFVCLLASILGSILDAQGNWTVEEGLFKKLDLCRAHDLDPRDLRKLDSVVPNLVPLILTRRSCILISILHIRALIKPDRVILFSSPGIVESPVQKRLMNLLEKNIKAGLNVKECEGDEEVILNYEHRALESILVSTSNALEMEMNWTREVIENLFQDLEADVNRDNLKRLLHYSRRLVGFQSRAKYVKRAVEELLESDEDLSAMYITSRTQGKPRALHDHEQLELLFESFVKQVEEIVSEVDTTVANMQSTQEVAELMLDSGRNALIALDVKVHMATLGIGTGALVAGIFGMNLHSSLETTPYAFYIICGLTVSIAIAIWVHGLRIIRRVRHIALSSKNPTHPSSYPSWEAKMIAENAAATNPHIAARKEAAKQWAIFRNLMDDKLTMWDRLFRRGAVKRRMLGMGQQMIGPHHLGPIWMNERADQARARDALRFQEMQEKEKEQEARLEEKTQWMEVKNWERKVKNEERGKRWKDKERSKLDWGGRTGL